MRQDNNIIAIRKSSLLKADECFRVLMNNTEQSLNQRAVSNPGFFRDRDGSKLEPLALDFIKEAARDSPFNPENISLVSAQHFPDIIAEGYYGVEVKTTKENRWTSTGSSIVETTRIKDVESIYLLFGKLGGNPAEFKCRPYEDCMDGITVTHSPRYLIDMSISENDSIFKRLGITYDDFRVAPDKIDRVRDYYIKSALKQGKHEMPWWIGANDNLTKFRLWNELDISTKKDLCAKIVILFPEVFNSDYRYAALWLCTRHSVVCMNMRDPFSAGGKLRFLNGRPLAEPIPHVWNNLRKWMPSIKDAFNSKEFESEIMAFHPDILQGDHYENWRDLVSKYYPLSNSVDFISFLETPELYILT